MSSRHENSDDPQTSIKGLPNKLRQNHGKKRVKNPWLPRTHSRQCACCFPMGSVHHEKLGCCAIHFPSSNRRSQACLRHLDRAWWLTIHLIADRSCGENGRKVQMMLSVAVRARLRKAARPFAYSGASDFECEDIGFDNHLFRSCLWTTSLSLCA